MEPQRTRRKLAAILAADVVGYSRLMGEDEVGTLAALKAHSKELIDPKITEHEGRVIKLMGDGMLVEFPSVVEAVQCAVEIQRALTQRNAGVPENRRLEFRIGVNLGDVIIDGDDIYGDGVNVAARLEGLAEPGGICVRRAVRNQVRDKLPVVFEDLGEVEVKNIIRPVRVFRVLLEPPSAFDAPPPLPDKPSIAVLPFANMSGDPEQEYFADGIAEDIITNLSRIHWLFVIARNSSFAFKGQAVDIQGVARKLGIRYVLEGSVRKAANQVRVTAQLIDARSRSHLWAERYDRELADIFAVQDEITQSVAAAIEPRLLAAEGLRSESRSPADFDAWDFVMRALAKFWRITKTDSEEAIGLLRQAVERHPDYGPAHSMLAFVLSFSGHMGWIPVDDARELARPAARRAVMIDDADPWAHLGLGYLHIIDRQTDYAVTEFKRAIELNANSAAAHGFLGAALALGGHSEEAIPELEQAMRLSPQDPQNAYFVHCIAVAHYLAGHYEQAVDWARRSVQMRSDFIPAHRMLCASLAQHGLIDEATVLLSRIRELQPDISRSLLERASPLATPSDMAHFLEGMHKAGLPE